MFDYKIINSNDDVADAFLLDSLQEAAKALNDTRNILIHKIEPLTLHEERLLNFLNCSLDEIRNELSALDKPPNIMRMR